MTMRHARCFPLLRSLLAAVAGLALGSGCSGTDQAPGKADAATDATADATADATPGATADLAPGAEDGGRPWEQLPTPEARRETISGYTVVWLHGTPYEMGRQQAELLAAELHEGAVAAATEPVLQLMFEAARRVGLGDLARQMSYPWILEECRGMVDALADPGWTEEMCLLLNFGDVIAEFLRAMPQSEQITPGCSQVVAAGAATPDGRLYHARNLDWFQIDFIVQHPVIFVRRPQGAVPHVVIGFPGNLSPYQGLNAAGLVVASNEVHPKDGTVNDRTGRSHVQLVGELLARAASFEEARQLLLDVDSMTLELLVVSDGRSGQAAAYELAPAHASEVVLADGLVYATNHFRASGTAPLDKEPVPESSALRLRRLEQLILPGGADSRYGALDPPGLAAILRDRVNPDTMEARPPDAFDDGLSLATNGALYQVIFDPAALRFWVAAGALPVPRQPLVGFSLAELLGMPGHGTDDRPTDIP